MGAAQKSSLKIRHLLVPCTNRKRTEAGELTCYSKTKIGIPEEWSELLSRGKEKVPAHNLYCGTSWDRYLTAHSRMPHAKLWIASAGYGLISGDTKVSAYSATFSPGSEDTVGRPWHPHSLAIRRWWIELSGEIWWKKLSHKDGLTVVVLSHPYMDALLPGLNELAKALKNRLVIIAPGFAIKHNEVDRCILSIDSRFEHIRKSTRGDIGPNALEWLSRTYPPDKGWDIGSIQSDLIKLFKKLPPIRRYNRKLLTDKDVLSFISNRAPKHACPSASSLLRELRSSGYACEQKRFGSLFHSFMDNMYHRKARAS